MRRALSALTIFTGSAVLFCLEPMTGNTLLPAFGGSSTVWVVCLAVFQMLMLLGYGYACLFPRVVRGRLAFHILLLLAAAGAVLYIPRSDVVGWLAANVPYPFLGVIAATLVLAAPAFVLLSANASLVQVLAGGEYRLYAVSNLGSFAGLLAYPFLLEPRFGLSAHWRVLAVAVVVYALMLAVLGCCPAQKRDDGPVHSERGAFVPWPVFFLSALSCFLLNSLTSHLCSDLTPLPFLWIAVLSLYLLSYVTAFTERGSRIGSWLFLPVAALTGLAFAGLGDYAGDSPWMHLGIGLFLVFFGGWLVHARMYRMRPEGGDLPRYYFTMAVGGAVGGLAASVAAPLVFNVLGEYPLALGLLLAVAVLDGAGHCGPRVNLARIRRPVLAGGAVLGLAGIAYLSYSDRGELLMTRRNFYGISRVALRNHRLVNGEGYQAHAFFCGSTEHGFQPVQGDWKRQIGTTYYEESSGGLAILRHPKRLAHKPLRVALAGMGIGTLAVFGEKGDLFRFYEINPAVVDIATNERLFNYVGKSFAKVEIVTADARQALERERARDEEKWDVIVIDVFSGDSIPPHMVTEEAMRLYLDRLAQGGILAFHLTNWHLDLKPVVKAAARQFGLAFECLECPRHTAFGFDALWAFLSRESVGCFDEKIHRSVAPEQITDIDLMTDDKHPLLPLVRY